ncbi:Troponin I [Halotydeus destructor]|nr:Troponin I [Halotydeus destructor]
MNRHVGEDELRKHEEKERKKADVRKRLEEAAKAKHAKKGFMTADRKKKLRNLLRAKAAEELKKEQERRAQERKRIIAERAGTAKSLDGNEASLMRICREYHTRISQLQNEKYDLEYETTKKDLILKDLNSQVNNMRGKFVKPSLKKVSKYEQKLEKMKLVAQKVHMDLRSSLKKVKSGVFNIEDTDKPTD